MIFARVLILSFCSMCYELLLARTLAEITGLYILSYSFCFGFYLAGMGLGSACYGRFFGKVSPLKVFYRVEIGLAVLGGLSALFAFCFFTLLSVPSFPLWVLRHEMALSEKNLYMVFLLFMQGYVLCIGFLSGFELPIWLKIAKKRETLSSSTVARGLNALSRPGALLSASYVGGFLGSILVVLFITPKLGLMSACLLVGFINLACLVESLFSYKKLSLKKQVPVFLPVFLSAGAIFAGWWASIPVQAVYLKSYYIETRLKVYDRHVKNLKDFVYALGTSSEVLRIRSSYQNIDIVPPHFLATSGEFKRRFGLNFVDRGMYLYLNKQYQFSETFWIIYHEAMTVGGLHLSGKAPQNVLVLGGGDGLLVGRILKFYTQISQIVHVELDPKMIELANNHPALARMNQKALQHPKVKGVTADAFKYVARAKPGMYDAIFMDFPYPASFDLLRLYSVEFYTRVRRLLKPGGFVVADVPILLYKKPPSGRPYPEDVLYSTLQSAGFNTIFSFGGNYEPFLFLQVEKRELRFEKEKITQNMDQNIDPRTLQELTSDMKRERIKNIKTREEYVNSIFKPVPIRYK